jgi:hypothetical protein
VHEGKLLTYNLQPQEPDIRYPSVFLHLNVLLYTIVFSIVMPTTTDESDTQWNYILTTDPVSGFIFSRYSTTLG